MKKIDEEEFEEMKAAMQEAVANARQALGKIEEWLQGAQEAYDNHSESWQESEKGEAFQEWIDALTEKVEEVTDAADTLDGVTDDFPLTPEG